MRNKFGVIYYRITKTKSAIGLQTLSMFNVFAIETYPNVRIKELREDTSSQRAEGRPRYVIKPAHYKKLRDTDGTSFTKIMSLIRDIEPPIKSSHSDKMKKLNHWFLNLANFFFLVRASGNRVNIDQLSKEQQEQFIRAFTRGVGRLFHTHCVAISKKTINERRSIDPNDLYDAMQLLCLRDENRLFVTGERFFHYYEIDPEIQRVIAWEAFKSSS